jgi:hypothetical protein
MKKRYTVYLDPDTEKKLLTLSEDLKISISSAVRICIRNTT